MFARYCELTLVIAAYKLPILLHFLFLADFSSKIYVMTSKIRHFIDITFKNQALMLRKTSILLT